MAYNLLIHRGVLLDDFFSQRVDYFLAAQAAAEEEEIAYIDEVEA